MKSIVKIIVICSLAVCLSACRVATVRPGDTLYSIARQNDVPLRALIDENHLQPPYTLSVGQKLYLPKEKTYTVTSGDTLYSIATRHDMPVSSLAKYNNITAPYTIHQGQILRLSSWSDKPTGQKYASSGSVKADRQAEINRRKNLKNPSSFKGTASVPKSQAGKRFARPTSGKIISDFGPNNDGINIKGTAGSPITAADSGTVAYAGHELKGYGHLVLIRHKDGWITAYAHNQKLLVHKGDIIKKGQKIAEMGSSGNVKTPQLHFEIRYKAKVVNPHTYLK